MSEHEEEHEQIENIIDNLQKEILFLRRHIFLQSAQIKALTGYCIHSIPALTGSTKSQDAESLQGLTREEYDRLLLHIGDKYPQYSESSDIRSSLPPEEAEKWLYPEDYRPS